MSDVSAFCDLQEIAAEKRASFDSEALRGFFDAFLAEMKRDDGGVSTFTGS